ncbi:MAG: hypothetical protein PHO41_01865 [Eubacteriales bacterium]|nr:hypothetical protein [Eubacteriales bacterium]
MASYVLKGYQTPQGVASSADVAAYQRQLNTEGARLKVDGIWGPKTEAAYQQSAAMQVDALQRIQEYMQQILAIYDVPQVSYTPRSAASFESEYASFLRPEVDQSISRRKEATVTYQAELDADAISRGMGASTYVTDVKDRQLDAEADDIAAMESDYQATLSKMIADAVAAEQQRAHEAAVYNANQMASARQMAFSTAQEMYAADVSRQQAATASNRSGSKSKSRSNDVPATTPENCERFLQILTPSERAAVYQGKTDKDVRYQQELIASVGQLGYLQLQGKYPAK